MHGACLVNPATLGTAQLGRNSEVAVVQIIAATKKISYLKSKLMTNFAVLSRGIMKDMNHSALYLSLDPT